MFGIFKSDPVKKLRKEFEKLSEEAMHAQRNGNIELYAKLTQQADNIYKEIEKLELENSNK
ncbi:MAG: Lacal_2735 family protein [Oligoflexia bacterium]|nr:Lacal_2735 family protein [Oligoflexia bacterium]